MFVCCGATASKCSVATTDYAPRNRSWRGRNFHMGGPYGMLKIDHWSVACKVSPTRCTITVAQRYWILGKTLLHHYSRRDLKGPVGYTCWMGTMRPLWSELTYSSKPICSILGGRHLSCFCMIFSGKLTKICKSLYFTADHWIRSLKMGHRNLQNKKTHKFTLKYLHRISIQSYLIQLQKFWIVQSSVALFPLFPFIHHQKHFTNVISPDRSEQLEQEEMGLWGCWAKGTVSLDNTPPPPRSKPPPLQRTDLGSWQTRPDSIKHLFHEGPEQIFIQCSFHKAGATTAKSEDLLYLFPFWFLVQELLSLPGGGKDGEWLSLIIVDSISAASRTLY